MIGWVRRLAVSAIAAASVVLGLGLAVEVVLRVGDVRPTLPDNPVTPGARGDLLLGGVMRSSWSGEVLPAGSEGNFVVTTDEDGFRVTGFAAPDPAAATVAFVGDSCTFGWGVDDAETYVAQLDALQREAGPPRLALLNAGLPGTSAIGGVHHLRERVLPRNPDVVVIAFSAHNAFRISLLSDASQFRFFSVRKALYRSRLLQFVALHIASVAGPQAPPRNRKVVLAAPMDEWARVADPHEFEAAMREMVAITRDAGARPLFLLLPRGVEVYLPRRDFWEDAGYTVRRSPLAPHDGPPLTVTELGLLESSCLDVRAPDAVAQLHDRVADWQPLRPERPALDDLRAGATALLEGDSGRARASFQRAVAHRPDNPLALYALGASEIEAGDTGEGLAKLDRADSLACNVFLQYQVIVRRLAVALDVPVVDILLTFQAYDAVPLMRDSAHFSVRGNRVVAETIWSSPTLRALHSEATAR